MIARAAGTSYISTSLGTPLLLLGVFDEVELEERGDDDVRAW